MAFTELSSRKENMSKIKDIEKNELIMSDYLRPNDIIQNINMKQKIFEVRSNMLDIKINFPNITKNSKCRLGCESEENMEHLGKCDKIKKYINIKETNIRLIKNGNVKQVKVEIENV